VPGRVRDGELTFADVLAETLHATLEFAAAGVQHVPDVIVKHINVILGPAFQCDTVGQHSEVILLDMRSYA